MGIAFLTYIKHYKIQSFTIVKFVYRVRYLCNYYCDSILGMLYYMEGSMLSSSHHPREYWIIYRGPGFLAVVWFGSLLTFSHHPLPSVSCLSYLVWLVCRRSSLLTEGGEGGGRVTKSYNCEKAWPSINHLILADSPLPSYLFWLLLPPLSPPTRSPHSFISNYFQAPTPILPTSLPYNPWRK